jgi:ISXO2-like transposase domain
MLCVPRADLATRKNKPIYTQLRCVPGFNKEATKAYAEANIAPGARVLSDGLGCFRGLAEAGLKHKAVVRGSGRPRDARFKWTNTGLGNIERAIAGTCRSFDPQHTERYLAGFEWRFNCRFDLDKNVERLARVAARTAPAPYQSIAAVRS